MRVTATTAPTAIPAITPGDKASRLDVEAEPIGVEAAVSVELGTACVAVDDVPAVAGEMLNTGERLTLLELESSVILNWYCCVVGTSDGIRRLALPLFVSIAVWRKCVSHNTKESREGARSGERLKTDIPG